MKIMPVFNNALKLGNPNLKRNVGILAGTVILIAGAIGLISQKKRPDPIFEAPEYQKALNTYKRDLINYNNFKEDSTYFREHDAYLKDMKALIYDQMKEDIPDIESYTEEELSEMNGTYKMLDGVIARNQRDWDVSTGKVLEQSRKRVEYIRDSLMFDLAKKKH